MCLLASSHAFAFVNEYGDAMLYLMDVMCYVSGAHVQSSLLGRHVIVSLGKSSDTVLYLMDLI